MAKDRTFKIDHFLGLNEGADGLRELKMGEASRVENFAITDDGNLKTRPGINRLEMEKKDDDLFPLAMWAGIVGTEELLVYVGWFENERIYVFRATETGHELVATVTGALGIGGEGWNDNLVVKVFPFAGKLYIMSQYKCVVYEGGSTVSDAAFYVPVVLTGTAPSGGGTVLENINLLTPLRRVRYSGDGESAVYKLPDEAVGVTSVLVNGEDVTDTGVFDEACKEFTLPQPPTAGANNVEITYSAESSGFSTIGKCPYFETYNGTTETRLWFYGDGTNKVYYSGVPMDSDLSKLYVPAMNEIAVDLTPSPVTGLVRHYNRLFAFKPDGACTITYQPTTLEDGRVIAGFTVRNVRKDIGNEAPGQVSLVNNYPRTFSHGNLYEWRTPTNYLVDERYEKSISMPIRSTISRADFSKIVTCDDNRSGTYYVFLNDAQGTVLVNRIRQEVWTVYRSECAKNIRFAVVFRGKMYFASEYNGIFYLDEKQRYDGPVKNGGEQIPIRAFWESGFMDFGADNLRKYSSYIWLSMLPEPGSHLTLTAETDRRSSYVEKQTGSPLYDPQWLDYDRWAYNTDQSPQIDRLKMKVKKFVFYKLILRVTEPGTVATVLSIDQQVRYSGQAK